MQENSKTQRKNGLKLTNFSKDVKNDILSENRLIISNQKTVANKFNDYFINVAQNVLKDLSESNNEFQDYLKNPNKHPKNSSDIFEIFPKLITVRRIH